MRMQTRLVVLLASLSICTFLAEARQAPASDNGVVTCRVLEAHASTHPAVVAVVFHQRDKADQARLASLLQNLSAENVELQTPEGKWMNATVARLKSCFGRGLLLLPADAPPLKDGSTFTLRFSPMAKQN